MSFEEEWARHKAAGADNQTHMRLNGHNEENRQGGAPDLAVHQDDLGAVGHDAYVLHGKLKKQSDINAAGRDDSDNSSTERAARELRQSNFETGTALRKTGKMWESQCKTLLQGCAHISNHLDYTKKSHANDDDKVAASMPNPPSVSAIHKYIR